VRILRSPETIRARCRHILELAEKGAPLSFVYDGSKFPAAVDYILDTIRERYPTLAIPYHSRWRHFEAGGTDRWARLKARSGDLSRAECARIRFDLVIPSVLLDAGAGADWLYREQGAASGVGRSEGLAVATFHMFGDGVFSADPAQPLRTDGARLGNLTERDLERAFQVSADNPLVGLAGRTALMRRLGQVLLGRSDIFGSPPRLGHLVDYLAERAPDKRIAAAKILGVVLDVFAPIWPGRIELDGVNLGDVWRHSSIKAGDATDGLIPFHKLSQWLTYSLVEPLEEAGFAVTGLDALTGLPEYRNGGLFVDLDVLRPTDPAAVRTIHRVDSVLVVEWRALTVALLDRVVDAIREKLKLDAAALPLAKVLEGGTWAAGRKIARTLRPDGTPPIRVESDGTVF
jgi:hypothetical protein